MPAPGRALLPDTSLLTWPPTESKSPARFPARAHFLSFNFKIRDSRRESNNNLPAPLI
jgi:hypothetical protein